MKTIIKSIQRYAFEAFSLLCFTNIWIYGYTIILAWLNSNFFPSLYMKDDLLISVSPEPFEAPLYILSVLVMFGLLFFFSIHQKRLKRFFSRLDKSNFIISAGILLLFLLFAIKLGPYPLVEEPMIQKIINMGFYTTLALVITYVSTILWRILEGKKLLWIGHIYIYAMIAMILFEPRFPIGTSDYAHFIGPVYEIAKGKTIYTQISSQYGFLSILLLSIAGKWFPLLLIMPYVVWFVSATSYYLAFITLLRVTRSVAYSFVGLWSIITVNYFSLVHLGLQNPQIPLRWFPIIVSIYLFARVQNTQSKILIFCLSLLVFWFVDMGIELTMAFFLTLMVFLLYKKISFRDAIDSVMFFIFSVICIFLTINVVHILLGYVPVDPVRMFQKLREFALLGFYMEPMEPKTFFWIIIPIYLCSIFYFIAKQKKKDENVKLLVFAANSSFFAGLYYIGRSIEHNLFHISIFVILNAFIVCSFIYKKIQYRRHTLVVLIVLFIALPAYFRQQAISDNIRRKVERFKQGDIFLPELNQRIQALYKDEVMFIQKENPQKDVIIISADDTYLFYLTKKYNLLNVNPQMILYSKSEIQSVVQQLSQCPDKIFVSCSFGKKDCLTDLNLPKWYPKTQAILLQAIENKCRVRYITTLCTNRLCVAKKQEFDSMIE